MRNIHSLAKKLTTLLLAFVLVFSVSVTANAATTPGTISGVANYKSGIKVTWNTDSKKAGYIIYRRSGSSTTWKNVKKITSKTTSNWTDTSVTNGTKYVYKVCSYKGSTITKSTTAKTIYRLSTPTMTLEAPYAGAIKVTSNSNSAVSGYQIKYSASSSFSSAKTITVSDVKTLKKAIDGLSCGKKYYVKIRSFKTVSGTKYYSGYCASKALTTTSPQTTYTTNMSTTLYTKASTSSDTITIKYKTPVSMYGHYKICDNGVWEKVKYNSKIYYVWVKSGDTKFSKSAGSYNYKTSSTTTYQNAVIDKALEVKDWPTEYAHGQSKGVKNANGKYGFDCSGLVSYITNTAMQKSCPAYYVSYDLKKLYETNSILNTGYSSELKAKTVCTKIDLSKMQAGDVIFFDLPSMSNRDGLSYDHCGIYLGNNEFIHSANSASGGGVTIMPLEGDYSKGFLKVIRVLPQSISPINESYYVNSASALPVYSKMDKSSTVKSNLSTETPITLKYISCEGKWAYIGYDSGKVGFVETAKISNTSNLNENRWVVAVKLKLYQNATTSSDSIEVCGLTPIVYDGQVGTGNYYKVTYEGQRYYVYTTGGIDSVLTADLDSFMAGIESRTLASDASVFAAPNDASERLIKLSAETSLRVLAYSASNTWALVMTDDGSTGYMLVKHFTPSAE